MTAGYLVDASVLSMLAPDRPPIPEDMAAWLETNDERLYLSAITVAEIEQGICKLRRLGGIERARRLTEWLDDLQARTGDRVLAVDFHVARAAGILSGNAVSIGRHPGFPDVAIAATAIVHQLTLLTRNGKHFASLDVDYLDPFETPPVS
ncbi:type II toxin-antitoxin system VapC family toxin [Inquilinus sp. CAU 1745]|uniref:type II toxin-antitoxin system VapC family toxin n=1 Tax=Inquilinus sp. CAU 1745 TaxID=3140369 RepID=UPI00325B9140